MDLVLSLSESGDAGAVAPLLLAKIAETTRDYNWSFTREMWSRDPALSLRLALEEFQRDPDGELAGHWFIEAPGDMELRRPLLAAVRKLAPHPPVNWLRLWLLHMLPTAGARADEIYALMRGERPEKRESDAAG